MAWSEMDQESSGRYMQDVSCIKDPETAEKGLVLSCARQLSQMRPFLDDPKVKHLFTIMLYVRQKLLMYERILKYCSCCL